MLANERFVQNAPADVVDAEREKLERYRRELAALDAWERTVADSLTGPATMGRTASNAIGSVPRSVVVR